MGGKPFFSYLMLIHLSSVNESMAKTPPSRPMPLFFTPPNGAILEPITVVSLTRTMPDCIFGANFKAAERSFVMMADERP